MSAKNFASIMQGHGKLTNWYRVLSIFALLVMLGASKTVWAQQGDDFWFDIPEMTRAHFDVNNVEIYLHVASNTEPVRVHVEMPAEPDFKPFHFDMQPSSEVRLGLANLSWNTPFAGGKLTPKPGKPTEFETLPLVYHPKKHTKDIQGCPLDQRGKFIENLLCWAETNTSLGSKSYINRTNKGVHMWCETHDTIWITERLEKLMKDFNDELAQIDRDYAGVGPGDPLWATYLQKMKEARNKMRRERREKADVPGDPGYTGPTPSGKYYFEEWVWKPSRTSKQDSKSLISSYIEYAGDWNMELIALKADNARGTDFFVPMQTDLPSTRDYYARGYRAHAYPSFNIVATQDNTTLTIRTPNPIFEKEEKYDWCGGKKNTGKPITVDGQSWHEYTIFLEKAGQTCIIPPYARSDHGASSNYYQTAWRKKDPRLQGSRIISDKEVTVTSKDDLVITPGPDYVSDQLVPTELLGKFYGVVRGVVASKSRINNEYFYVVATKKGTKITIRSKTGSKVYTSTYSGQQFSYHMIAGSTTARVSVEATDPVLVFHMSGVEDYGMNWGQKGGAILPALPEDPKTQCIGSSIVPFTRTQGSGYPCYLDLLAFDHPNSDLSALGHFILQKQVAFNGISYGFMAVTNDAAYTLNAANLHKIRQDEKVYDQAAWNLQEAINGRGSSPASWTSFPQTASIPALARWKSTQIATDNYNTGGKFALNTLTPYRLINTANVFQLGILNGSAGMNVFYGYFSDYAKVKVSVQAQIPDPQTGLMTESNNSTIRICYGDNATLEGPYNPNYHYEWLKWKRTDEVVLDGKIKKVYVGEPLEPGVVDEPNKRVTYMRKPEPSPNPYKFVLKVTGSCEQEATGKLDVKVGNKFNTKIMMPSTVCVNPFASKPKDVDLVVKGIKGLDTKKLTYKDAAGKWQTEPGFNPPDTDDEATQTLQFAYSTPTTDPTFGDPIEKSYRLELADAGCTQVENLNIRVYPEVPAITLKAPGVSATPSIAGSSVLCSPVEVTPTLELAAGTPYPISCYWRLPDGSFKTGDLDLDPSTAHTIPLSDPNFAPPPSVSKVTISNGANKPKEYKTSVEIVDSHGVCATRRSDEKVTVAPLVSAFILLSNPAGGSCTPFNAVASFGTSAVNTSWRWQLEKESDPVAHSYNDITDPAKAKQSNYDLLGTEAGHYKIRLDIDNGACAATPPPEKEFDIYASPTFDKNFTPTLKGRSDGQSSQCSPAIVQGTLLNVENTTRIEWFMLDDLGDETRLKESIITPSATPQAVPVPDIELKNTTPYKQDYRIFARLYNSKGCMAETPKTLFTIYPAISVSIGKAFAYCVDVNGVPSTAPGMPADPIAANIMPAPDSYTVGGVPYNIEWSVEGHTVTAVPGEPYKFDFANHPEFKRKKNPSDYTDIIKPRLTAKVVWATPGGQSCWAKDEASIVVYPRIDEPNIGIYGDKALSKRLLPTDEHCASQRFWFNVQNCAKDYDWAIERIGAVGNKQTFAPGKNENGEIAVGGLGVQDLEVKLKVSNRWCPDFAKETKVPLKIKPLLKPKFLMEVLDPCNPVVVKVEDFSVPKEEAATAGIIAYDWSYGAATPTVTGTTSKKLTFTKEGKHKVKLTMSYVSGEACPATYPDKNDPNYADLVLKTTVDVPENISIKDLDDAVRYDKNGVVGCSPLSLEFSAKEKSWASGKNYIAWKIVRDPKDPDPFDESNKHKPSRVVEVSNDNVDGPVEYYVIMKRGIEGKECKNQEEQIAKPIKLTVFPNPVAHTTLFDRDKCAPLVVSLENNSKFADEFTWTFTPAGANAGNGVKKVVNSSDMKTQTVELPNNSTSNEDVSYTVAFEARKRWDLGGGVAKECKSQSSQVLAPRVVHPEIRPKFKVQIGGKDVTTLCSGAEVTFTDNSTGGAGVKSSWTFGSISMPKTTVTGETFTYSKFVNEDEDTDKHYIVNVKTSRGGECERETSIDLAVHRKVVANFSFDSPDMAVQCGEGDVPYVFTNNSQAGKGTMLVNNWTWSFGDGTPDVVKNAYEPSITHAYNHSSLTKAKRYPVRLSISQQYDNGTGVPDVCEDSKEDYVTIVPVLSVEIVSVSGEAEVCGGTTLELKANAKGGQSIAYTWYNNAVTPIITPKFSTNLDVAENQTVSVDVENEFGCKAHAEYGVKVHPTVLANFKVERVSKDCPPVTYEITQQSKHADTYEWRLGTRILSSAETATTPFPLELTNETTSMKDLELHLLAKNSAIGCKAEKAFLFHIPGKVSADFELLAGQTPEGCNPLKCDFVNKSTGATSYTWTLDSDGTSTAPKSVSHIFENSSTEDNRNVTVTLTAKSGDCDAQKDMTLTVYPKVYASFDVTASEGCAPLTTYFSNGSISSAYSYEWELGAGKSKSNLLVPGEVQHTGEYKGKGKVVYEDPNNKATTEIYHVSPKLIVRLSDHPDCWAQQVKNLQVFPATHANFEELPPYSCSPYKISTRSTSTGYSGGKLEYNWTLDGNQLSKSEVLEGIEQENRSHTAPQTYTLSLDVVSQHACADHKEHTFTVYPNPQAILEIDDGNNPLRCQPVRATVKSLSQGLANMAYIYDFGDQKANKNPGDNPSTEGSMVAPSSSTEVKHTFWNEKSPVEEKFQVSLTALNRFDIPGDPELVCADTETQSFGVKPKVEARFDIDPPRDAFCSNDPVRFVSASTRGEHTWYEDDQPFAGGVDQPTHRFENLDIKEKSYTIKLGVVTKDGCKDSTEKVITIWPTPVARFSVTPEDQRFPDNLVEIKNESYPDSPDWNHKWSFGDGKEVADQEVTSHIYEDWGPKGDDYTYTIKLQIENTYCSGEVSQNVTIRPPKPTAGYIVDKEVGCPPFKVLFKTAGECKYTNSWLWDFGDGSPISVDREPEHVFEKPGKYQVRLVAQGEGGSAEFLGFITVLPQPKPAFQVLPAVQKLPNRTISCLNLTEFGEKFRWDFGDGSEMVEEASPHHEYADPGEYTITLYAYSENGCDEHTQRRAHIVAEGNIRFPSAFRPDPNAETPEEFASLAAMNKDTRNRVFHPYIDGAVKKYQLRIYNRWGEQIYETPGGSTPWLHGWNGYVNHKICPMGVYGYRCTGEYHNGELFDISGNVTLFK